MFCFREENELKRKDYLDPMHKMVEYVKKKKHKHKEKVSGLKDIYFYT